MQEHLAEEAAKKTPKATPVVTDRSPDPNESIASPSPAEVKVV